MPLKDDGKRTTELLKPSLGDLIALQPDERADVLWRVLWEIGEQHGSYRIVSSFAAAIRKAYPNIEPRSMGNLQGMGPRLLDRGAISHTAIEGTGVLRVTQPPPIIKRHQVSAVDESVVATVPAFEPGQGGAAKPETQE